MIDSLHERLVALADTADVPPLDVRAVAGAGDRRRRRALTGGVLLAAALITSVVVVGVQVGDRGDATEQVVEPPALTPSPTPSTSAVSIAPALRRMPVDAEHELVVTSVAESFRLNRVLVTTGLESVDLTPAGLPAQDQFLDLAVRGGRLWLVTGDCAMGTMSTWTSADGAAWTRHPGPGSPHCSAGSGTLLRLQSADRATAFVFAASGPQTTRWTTPDGGATWTRQSEPGDTWPADSATPAAGICGQTDEFVATITVSPDTPRPRCLQAGEGQPLRVVNDTNAFGQPPRSVVVQLAGFSPRRLEPGESTSYPAPMTDFLAPGVHRVDLSLYGSEIWVKNE